MTPEQIKALQDALIKEIGEGITEANKTQVKELFDSFAKDNTKSQEDMKEEIKSLKEAITAQKTAELTDDQVKSTIVNIFKSVSAAKNVSEAMYKEIAEKEVKSLDTLTGAAGGNLVFDQFQKDIIKVMDEFELVKRLKWITLEKGDDITLPKATNGITTVYVNQKAKGTESGITFDNITIDVNKTFSLVNVTEEMFDNMTTQDIYALIIEFIGESQAEFVENEVVKGDGTKVTGIQNLPSAHSVVLPKTTIGACTTEELDNAIIDIESVIKAKYMRSGDVWFIANRYVLGRLRKMRTSDGARLYPDLRGKNPELDGFPIIISDVAGEITSSGTDATGKIVLAFGNLKYFQMVRRKELTIERGFINDGMATGIESIVGKQRFGGAATIEEAFAVLKTA